MDYFAGLDTSMDETPQHIGPFLIDLLRALGLEAKVAAKIGEGLLVAGGRCSRHQLSYGLVEVSDHSGPEIVVHHPGHDRRRLLPRYRPRHIAGRTLGGE